MIVWSQIAITYLGVALCIAPSVADDAADVRARGLRCGWFAAFLCVTCLTVERSDTRVLSLLPVALSVGVWVYATVVHKRHAGLGVLALVIDAGLRGHVTEALAIGASALLALGLARVIERRSQLLLRTLAYWLTFVGTFAWLLPASIVARTASAGEPLWKVAAVLAASGATLAVIATSAFYKAGGTPEPSDPPSALVTSGLYARVRHPIQLAEILLVAAGLALQPNLWVALYAVVFTVVLLGPARIAEEQKLEARFGDAYRSWRSQVATYVF